MMIMIHFCLLTILYKKVRDSYFEHFGVERWNLNFWSDLDTILDDCQSCSLIYKLVKGDDNDD